MASLSSHNIGIRAIVMASVSAIVLTACDAPTEGGATVGRSTSAQGNSNREIEAPDAYSTQSKALWDGRPSFGGAWIAAADVTSPEQVRIENTANGKVIKAALYRRERDLPGPPIQVSMDAAKELGMQAGTPVELRVVAIRKETVEVPPVNTGDAVAEEARAEENVEVAAAAIAGAGVAVAAAAEGAAAESGEALPEITTTTEIAAVPVGDLGAKVPTLASATSDAIISRGGTSAEAMFAAAADAADAAALAAKSGADQTTVIIEEEPLTGETVAAALAAIPETVPAAASTDGALKYPYIQISTVGSQADADAVVSKLSAAGLKAGTRQTDEKFAVLVGPLKTAAEQTAALATSKKIGYSDAFLTK